MTGTARLWMSYFQDLFRPKPKVLQHSKPPPPIWEALIIEA